MIEKFKKHVIKMTKYNGITHKIEMNSFYKFENIIHIEIILHNLILFQLCSIINIVQNKYK